tara:strand:- start:159 stop:689 length:531 start_codon:yes stop_codon:yes gene_type:complete
MVKKEVNKKAQIWVETVIYTLIALSLIGAVLSFAAPKIQELQDKAVIDQTITVMTEIDNVITSVVHGGVGNKRIIDLTIKQGSLKINAESEEIVFEMQSSYIYSQIGEEVNIGKITALTEESGSENKITLTANYSEYDLNHEDKNEIKTATPSPTPYKFSVENNGGTKTIVNFVIS